MSHLLYPMREAPRPPWWSAWMNRVLNVLLVVGLGVLLGTQYMAPDKRLLSVAAAAIVVGIAWRLDTISAIGVMILALPYPRGITIGSTNLVLIILLLVIYLLRMSQREAPPPRATAIDAPLGAFFLVVVISFYNVANSHDFYFAIQNFVLLVGTILMLYLVVSNVRSTRDLERLHNFYMISILSIGLIVLWEISHPGGTLVPGWIAFESSGADEFGRHGLRVGATFYDYELLADYCGLNLLFLVFLFVRARNTFRRVFVGGLIVLTLFVMFATVTRGPLVSLSVAVLFMLWMMRRRLRIVPLTIGVAVVLSAFFGMNLFVSKFTRSGDLFSRVAKTEFVGWMPDTRVGAWTDAVTRMMVHPIIGYGPYYASEHGLKFWYWPHNLYLYVGNITGLLGLSLFLWLLATFWRITTPKVDTLNSPDYVQSYLFIAHVQVAFFLVDQFKIEYMRNNTYQYQVWLMFAMWVAGYKLQNAQRELAPGSGRA